MHQDRQGVILDSHQIKSLKASTKYSYVVRAYKKVDGITYYSAKKKVTFTTKAE